MLQPVPIKYKLQVWVSLHRHSNGTFTQKSKATTKTLPRCNLFASVKVPVTLTSLKIFCFCNSTALQHNTNLLQTRSKNAAFVAVFIRPAQPSKNEQNIKSSRKSTTTKKSATKTGTQVLLSIKRDSYLDHEILAEAPPWLSPFLSQSSHVIFKLA